MTNDAKDLLLFVWVHGFKGNEVTFESFPDRVCHLLRETHPTLRVESRVFPAYQTRGDLLSATLAFVDWLTTLVVELEVDHGAGGGAGKAKIVLMGHSMGGLLIADAARDIAANTRDGDPMWPKIVAAIAFDTPYLGLHPHVFKHGISTAAGYYDTARTVASNLAVLSPVALGLGFGKFGKSTETTATAEAGPSRSKAQAQPPSRPDTPSKSFWSGISDNKALYGLGALAVGAAAAGTAYYTKEHFVNGWKWGYEHMIFVGNLWDAEALEKRLQGVEELEKKHGVMFQNHYTHIPPTPTQLLSRTFSIVPRSSSPTAQHWYPQDNTIASDEVTAHMGMFNARSNDGFYALGLRVVGDVGARIEAEGVIRREAGSGDWAEAEKKTGQGRSDAESRESGLMAFDENVKSGLNESTESGDQIKPNMDDRSWRDTQKAGTLLVARPSPAAPGNQWSIPDMGDKDVWK